MKINSKNATHFFVLTSLLVCSHSPPAVAGGTTRDETKYATEEAPRETPYAKCGPEDQLNSFSVSIHDRVVDVVMGGAGRRTVASEILSYMKKAGSRNGVIVEESRIPIGDHASASRRYKLDRIRITESISDGQCPPLETSVKVPLRDEDQWSASTVFANGKAKLAIRPAAPDSLTLAKLMRAAGVEGIKDEFLEGNHMNYRGRNIWCVIGKTHETETEKATCGINLDPSK